ncbi:hypothetical protein Acsp04_64740 [Actinomadura sp. NBRC 104425]|nr:hypothetical protein Acsp04_64740 [Actinomadura sp. NBRC 104425]
MLSSLPTAVSSDQTAPCANRGPSPFLTNDPLNRRTPVCLCLTSESAARSAIDPQHEEMPLTARFDFCYPHLSAVHGVAEGRNPRQGAVHCTPSQVRERKNSVNILPKLGDHKRTAIEADRAAVRGWSTLAAGRPSTDDDQDQNNGDQGN